MKRVVLLMVAAGALAACGTTVPQAQQVGGAVSQGAGSGDPAAAVDAPAAGGLQAGPAPQAAPGAMSAQVGQAPAPAGATSIPVTGDPGTAGPPATGPNDTVKGGGQPTVAKTGAETRASKSAGPTKTTTPASGSATAGAGATTAGASGTGFTSTTITIGYATTDVSTYATSLGISGIATGDTTAQFNAIAAYLNARGGIQGRKIVYSPYQISTAQGLANPDQAADSACASWTQDDKVFAVVDSQIDTDDAGVECIAGSGTPLVDANLASYLLIGEPTYEKYPDTLFTPASFNADRLAKLFVSSMQRTHYLTGWNTATGAAGTAPVKFGIFVGTDPVYAYAGQQLIAALKAAGYPIASSDIISTGSGLSSSSAAQSAAVLQFRSDGVTHVISMGLPFIEAAASQHYYPRYAFPGQAETFAENAPQGSLAGAVAIGANPAFDTDAAHQPALSAASSLCLKIMSGAGQDTSDLSTVAAMESECDPMFTLAAALNSPAAGGVISPASLRAGYDSLGAGSCAFTFQCVNGPLPGGHAGATAVQDMTYDATCTCFTYVDGVDHTS